MFNGSKDNKRHQENEEFKRIMSTALWSPKVLEFMLSEADDCMYEFPCDASIEYFKANVKKLVQIDLKKIKEIADNCKDEDDFLRLILKINPVKWKGI